MCFFCRKDPFGMQSSGQPESSQFLVLLGPSLRSLSRSSFETGVKVKLKGCVFQTDVPKPVESLV